MKKSSLLLAGVMVGGLALADAAGPVGGNRLWYRTPAADSYRGWERQSLPIGNGWFGANVFGIVTNERVQVTHNAVETWNNLTDALEIRLTTDHRTWSDYARGLDLDTGLAWVDYASDGVKYRRECVASYPAKAMALRLTASKRGALSFVLSAEAPFLTPYGDKEGFGRRAERTASSSEIDVYQELEHYAIRFDSRLKLVTDGQSERAGEGAIRVRGATEAVVFFACDTNYRLTTRAFAEPNPKRKLEPIDPRPEAKRLVEAAAKKGWTAFVEEQREDLAGLMGRVELDLGGSAEDAALPTDELLAAYAKGRASAWLEQVYFQFGRYLLVSSSRPGTLPANLQGVWTCHRRSPWGAGYWHNINVQMNYWPAFSCNLAECFEAYAAFNAAFRPATRSGAIDYIRRHVPGQAPVAGEAPDLWSVGTAVYPYGAQASPGGHSGPGTGGLTTKLFADWWLFTRDRRALERYVWPTVHGMADFLTRCVVETNGLCLAAFSASPEQMPKDVEDTFRWGKDKVVYYQTVGCAFDQQMIWENNHDLLLLAKELGTNDAVVAKVRGQIDRYDPVQVGESGQLKEFREERRYGDIGQYRHRHISQLVGLMPGTLVTKEKPAWMAAARVSLTERGDDSTGWALAHRLNAWARLGDGAHAHRLIRNLLGKRTYANLWDAHPPFQIDGNFGATAGIAEMLVQSHAGSIDLLPALPPAWAAKGSFKGLCVRGGWQIDCAWCDGKPVSVKMRKATPNALSEPKVCFAGRPWSVGGKSCRLK